MTKPYDEEALWLKAKVFLNRAMDEGELRSFDEQAFWASASLELLGKAALAKQSPLLIAEPTEEGANLLIAAGLIEGTARFKSVSASTIFKRCQRAFKPFRTIEAEKLSSARNEYLHGASVGFMPLRPENWWPTFWALAVILLTAQDRTIEELVGPDREKLVEAHLEQNKKNVEERTEALLERARQRLALFKAGALPAKELSLWAAQTDLTAGMDHHEFETCPACGAQGVLEGDESGDVEMHAEPVGHETDWMEYWSEVEVTAEWFSCPTCHLVLDRFDLIARAGLPEGFIVIDEDPIDREPDYGND